MYIEVFFIDNFIMNALILRMTSSLVRRKAPLWLILLGSALGALYASLSVTVARALMLLPFKLSLGFVIALFIPFRSFKDYALNVAALYFSSFVAGGAVVCLQCIIEKLCGGNGAIGSVSFTAAFLGAASAFAAPRFFRKLHGINLSECTKRRLRLCHKGIICEFEAVIDTGNSLKEPISGIPVIIVNAPQFTDFAFLPIPYATIDAQCIMYGFMPDRIEIYQGGWIAVSAAVALSQKELVGTKAILPPSVLPA